MAAPLKPWERVGVNYQNNVSLPSNSMAGPALGGESLHGAVGGVAASPLQTSLSSPPQLPPRPTLQSSYGSRLGGGGYGSPYSGFGGGGGYSSFSNPYSSFGSYGGLYNSPYSNYGGYGQQNTTSSFARQAEESSRPAFESIESIVHAVSSVGMMLDSTFSAVYNSFRAVIGVADNFARLKSQLIQVFSALAFIRTLRYMFRRILELLRLRPKGEADVEWRKAFNAAAAAASSSPGGEPKRSSWPILMFFGIIMGGPYLIWKLISKFSSEEVCGWAKGRDDHFVAKANYNFQGQGSEELSFSAGQEIRVAPKELQPRVRGWLMASVDGNTTGLIPANYVTVLGKKKGHGQDQPNEAQITQSNSQGLNLQGAQPSVTDYVEQMESFNSEKDLNSYFGNSVGSLSNSNEVSQTYDNTTGQEAAEILDEVDK